MVKTIVVGSSKELLSKNLGETIDTFDHVVRFNSYVVQGYEKHVGSKEETWAVNLGLVMHPPTVRKRLRAGQVKYIWYVGNNFQVEDRLVKFKKELQTQFVVESLNFNVVDYIF